MSKVVLDVSMSLDGFTAGPNVREEEPMGDGGERLHAWKFGEGTDGEVALGQEVDETVGAVVVGRRTFDLGLGPWGGTPGLLDEIRIHLVPLLLGEGTPMFDGERAELIPEGKPVLGAVTHLRFRVASQGERQ